MRTAPRASGELKIVCARDRSPHAALGRAIAFLAAHPPFGAFRADHLCGSIAGQIERDHYVFALRDGRLVGYCGWGLCAEEIVKRHLAGGPAPSYDECVGGDHVLVMVAAASDAAVVRVVARQLRRDHPGRRIVGRRLVRRTPVRG